MAITKSDIIFLVISLFCGLSVIIIGILVSLGLLNIEMIKESDKFEAVFGIFLCGFGLLIPFFFLLQDIKEKRYQVSN
ncbi:MAG: hypothetical protein HWN67_02960 [Candidatus Helarchaeota archaeon]|nr:hypothetical protein [Candidatus Helarchaeota archaeon]